MNPSSLPEPRQRRRTGNAGHSTPVRLTTLRQSMGRQCGGMDLELVPAEITYGLERIIAFLQNVESLYDIDWAPGVKYADVRLADEEPAGIPSSVPITCRIQASCSNQ